MTDDPREPLGSPAEPLYPTRGGPPPPRPGPAASPIPWTRWRGRPGRRAPALLLSAPPPRRARGRGGRAAGRPGSAPRVSTLGERGGGEAGPGGTATPLTPTPGSPRTRPRTRAPRGRRHRCLPAALRALSSTGARAARPESKGPRLPARPRRRRRPLQAPCAGAWAPPAAPQSPAARVEGPGRRDLWRGPGTADPGVQNGRRPRGEGRSGDSRGTQAR